MAELADARDLKSREIHFSYRFDPGFRHHNIAGWSSSVARRAHNPKVVRFKSHSRNQKRKQSKWTAFSFLERCVPLSRNVMRTSCVMTASPCDVPFGRVKEYITSLCAVGATHHCAIALHHLPARANITLYKRPKLCYNMGEREVLLWLNQSSVKYQWISPLIL